MPRTPRTYVIARSASPRRLGLVAVLAFGAPAVLSAQQELPASHTVRTGDTLWDLAHQYLGDPFLWPDIYRLNTAVVEDPHWIYPGEVLRIAPSDAAAAVPATDTPPPDSSAAAPRVVAISVPDNAPADPADSRLFPPSRGSIDIRLVAGQVTQPPALRRGDFYASGWLTEGQNLPFGRVIGSVAPLQIASEMGHGETTLYTRIAIEPAAGAAYQVGDTLLVADVSKRIEGYGNVVAPRALGRVVEISGKYPILALTSVFGEVLHGLAVLPAEAFTSPGMVQPVPVTEGVEAAVVGWPGRQELKGTGNVLFLNRGRRDGVAPGDVFEIRRVPHVDRDGSVRVAEVLATLQVVHVRDRTATTRIVHVTAPAIDVGMQAWQVAKLPS
ncbi:MAG TPA: LysM peptidoglycan-binding domain-containing protein [Gemmatimonadales bacterium]|nr:LysM peptidoglycan-binding domain-containing protein [Gemmatimonadales bacterium]